MKLFCPTQAGVHESVIAGISLRKTALALLLSTCTLCFGGPVYEPIVGFRPAPSFPSGSLFRHSSGDLYGISDYFDILHRVSADGEFRSFSLFAAEGYESLSGFAETGTGLIAGLHRRLGLEKGNPPEVFLFDPLTERFSTLGDIGSFLRGANLRAPAGFVSHRGGLWGVSGPTSRGDAGAIFRIDEQTGEISLVRSLPIRGGSTPLFDDGTGKLWGTHSTISGTSVAVFRIDTGTRAFKAIASVNVEPGFQGTGPLSIDEDGNLWCATGAGAVIKIDPSTDTATVIAELPPQQRPSPDASPAPRKLVSDRIGHVWGTTQTGVAGGGSIFKVNKSTGELVIVLELDRTHGGSRGIGELVLDNLGKLWCTIGYPDERRAGIIVKIDPLTDGIETIVDFGSRGLRSPSGRLTPDGNGNLWGTYWSGSTPNVGGGVFKVNTSTDEFTIVTQIPRPVLPSQGLSPGAELTSGKDGHLWGIATGSTIAEGGAIYKVDPISWQSTNVVEFTGDAGSNPGGEINGPLASDSEGALWGLISYRLNVTTSKRMIFKLNPFTGEFTNVAEVPAGTTVPKGLTYDGVNSLWGVSSQSLVKVNAASGAVTLRSFTLPFLVTSTRLVNDGIGSLWATHTSRTRHGASYLIKIDISTGVQTKAVVFRGLERAPHTLGSDGTGTLWGTLGVGPEGRLPDSKEDVPDSGAVFKVNARTGRLTVPYTFRGISSPKTGVVSANLATDFSGNFYATLLRGGTRGFGSLLKFNRARSKTLFEFTGTKGKFPGKFPTPPEDGVSTLVQHTDGNLYGSTLAGGVLPDGKPAGAGQFYRLRFGPTPVTLPPEVVSSTSAILRGTINPNGKDTGVSFQYGTDQELQTFWTVGAGVLPPRTKPKFVSLEVSDLQPGQTYYYRILGENAENPHPQRGAIIAFSTPGAE